MLEEKIYTQGMIAEQLMKVMAEKSGTENPPHPIPRRDFWVVKKYYSEIVQRAAKQADNENRVHPIKNKGGIPYLYNLDELQVIVDYIEQERASGKKASQGYEKIGFGPTEVQSLRENLTSERLPH